MRTSKRHGGFVLAAFLILLAVIVILMLVMIPRMSMQLAHSRDAARLTDMRLLTAALESYRSGRGEYPSHEPNPGFLGWDVSHDGAFLEVLVSSGYLQKPVRDPIGDDRYHYRYFRYEANDYGCAAGEAFYVLGLKHFETAAYAARTGGTLACPGRDWSDEFAWVSGPAAAN